MNKIPAARLLAPTMNVYSKLVTTTHLHTRGSKSLNLKTFSGMSFTKPTNDISKIGKKELKADPITGLQ